LKYYGCYYNKDKNSIYIITERATDDLSIYIKSERLVNKEKYQIIYDICNQLKILHRENIAHRDIKPENILIFENNNIKRAKLCDYGISREIDEKTTQNRGTFTYMAPESRFQYYVNQSNEEPLKGDIWSFGMVMFEVLCDFFFGEKNHLYIIQKKIR